MTAAEIVVRGTTLLLPRGELIRDRWRSELLAELAALPADRRTRFALGVLLHAWSLRAAVRQEAWLELGRAPRPDAPLHCRLHLWHHQRVASADDGSRYRRCRDCGLDDPTLPRTANDGLAYAPLVRIY